MRRVVDRYLEEVVELVGLAHELSVDQDLWYFRVGIAYFLCRAAHKSTHALARLSTMPLAPGRSGRRTRDDRHRLYTQRGAHNHQQVDLVQILVQREIEPGNIGNALVSTSTTPRKPRGEYFLESGSLKKTMSGFITFLSMRHLGHLGILSANTSSLTSKARSAKK